MIRSMVITYGIFPKQGIMVIINNNQWLWLVEDISDQ